MGRLISMEFNFMKKIVATILIIFLLCITFNYKMIGANSIEEPLIASEAAILIDEKSGQILFGKNPDQKMNPASLTKIATAIYAIERGKLEDVVTVSENAREIEGTRVYLEIGERVTLKKLIQGLLINSGNDAAVAISEYLDGSEQQFANNINKYLQNIGLQDTNFVNPHGLYHIDHKTTARDLAKITQYAMKNNDFREMFGTKELQWDGESWDTTLYTHHKLLREEIPYEGVTGGKTGFVDQSGFTLITTATKSDLSVIAVTLKAQTEDIAYHDTVDLLDYGFDYFTTEDIPEGQRYEINNRLFISNETLHFTISKNDTITKHVTDNGLLEIRNQNQDLIASFQLVNVTQLKENVEYMIEAKEDSIKKQNENKYLILFGSILIICLLLLENRRIKRS